MTLFEHNHSIGSTTARSAIFLFAAWFFIRAPLVHEMPILVNSLSEWRLNLIDFPVWLAVPVFASQMAVLGYSFVRRRRAFLISAGLFVFAFLLGHVIGTLPLDRVWPYLAIPVIILLIAAYLSDDLRI